MLRFLKLVTIICVCSVMPSSMSARTPSVYGQSPAQASISHIVLSSPTKDSADKPIDSDNKQMERYEYYHPAEDRKPRVIEEFNHHYLDGSYEFKYILSNGVTRYEKSYWKHVGKGKKLLARKGFYSHPLKNHKYLTVFYTADEHGFQQDTAKFTSAVPTLPKYLDVPQLEIPSETSPPITTTTTQTAPSTTSTTSTTTTRAPKTSNKTTTRKPRVTTTQRTPLKPSEFNWIY